MKQVLLSISHLSKSYHSKGHRLHKLCRMRAALERDEQTCIKAVDDVSLDIYEGEIFGLIGSNGAGKSTILKMLCGLTSADSGTITLSGNALTIHSARQRDDIGALIEQPVFFPTMSAKRNLQYLGALNGNVTDQRINEMAELFGINDRMNGNINTFSLGMYQKIGIIQAIMHKPKLLVLDEPTNGLDPKWIIEVRDILKRLAKEYNMTIIISSHILSEIQELCDRIAIIDKGKIIKLGDMTELLNADNQRTFDDIEYDVSDITRAISVAANYQCRVITKGNIMLIRIQKDVVQAFNRDLILSGVMVNGITVRKQKLEDVFRGATSRSTVNRTIKDSGDTVVVDDIHNSSSDPTIGSVTSSAIIASNTVESRTHATSISEVKSNEKVQ